MVKILFAPVLWVQRLILSVLVAGLFFASSTAIPQMDGFSSQALAQTADEKKAKKAHKKKNKKAKNAGGKQRKANKKAKAQSNKAKSKSRKEQAKANKANAKARKAKAKKKKTQPSGRRVGGGPTGRKVDKKSTAKKKKKKPVDRRKVKSNVGGFGGAGAGNTQRNRGRANPPARGGGFGGVNTSPPRTVAKPSGKKKAGVKKRASRNGANRNLKAIRAKRKQRKVGGRTQIVEPGGRSIIKTNKRTIIRSRDRSRIGRGARNKRRVKGRRGGYTETVLRPNGTRIVSIFDRNGRLARRTRVGRGGRRAVLFNNRRRRHRGRDDNDFPFFVAIAAPIVAIAAAKYIVESDRVGYDGVYDTLRAPPVDDIEPRYTLDEVRYNQNLRERMRRVDVNTINFATGSWYISDSQFDELGDIARAINKILADNPDEVFMIEGHTDAVGDSEDNLSLSDRRAESVAIALSEEFDVPPENLTTQGYGEDFLKVATSGPERRNRRVSIRRITPLLARNEDGFDDDDYDVD